MNSQSPFTREDLVQIARSQRAIISQFATGALRRHGVRVGLMGAVESDLEALPPAVTPPSSGGTAQSSDGPGIGV